MWKALKLAWKVLWMGEERYHLLRTIDYVESPIYQAATYAVNKVGLDPILSKGRHEVKRAEALEWMGHWLKTYKFNATEWEKRFLMELAVGVKAGYLV
jgi:hypothetical protein